MVARPERSGRASLMGARPLSSSSLAVWFVVEQLPYTSLGSRSLVHPKKIQAFQIHKKNTKLF